MAFLATLRFHQNHVQLIGNNFETRTTYRIHSQPITALSDKTYIGRQAISLVRVNVTDWGPLGLCLTGLGGNPDLEIHSAIDILDVRVGTRYISSCMIEETKRAT